MFYSHEVLTSRKYGVATVWLVATLGAKSTLKKVSRKAILDVDVQKACEVIVTPEAPMALRLQSNLLYGVTRVYAQQCGYILTDAEAAKSSMRAVLNMVRTSALEAEGGHKGRADQLMLQDDPKFLPDFDLVPMELDQLDLDVTTMTGSQRSTLTPRASRASLDKQHIGGLIIPEQSASSMIGGPVGGFGAFGSVRGDSMARTRTDAGELLDLDDLGITLMPDGSMRMSDVPPPQPRESTGSAAGSKLGHASSPVRASKAQRSLDQDVLGHLENDGFMPIADDFAIGGDADELPTVGTEEQRPYQITTSESADASMGRRVRKAPRIIPADATIELRNGDLARWGAEYVANMLEVLRHRQSNRLTAIAKQNAEHWILGPGFDSLGFSDQGPLGMFSGAKLLEALTGFQISAGSKKRGHEEEPAVDNSRRVRSRSEPPHDEVGRGMQDDGYLPMMEDDTIEQGREAPTPLDDRQLSGIFPWNQSTGSRRPTGIFTSASFGAVGGGAFGTIASRRGSRLISASPLMGRGTAAGAALTDDVQDFDLQGDMDLTGLEEAEFELFGPAAQVDTQTAAQSQWQRSALDVESVNFLAFVQAGIQQADHIRAEADPGNEEDEALMGTVEFESLLPVTDNSSIVAAQGLLHVLVLGTKGMLVVDQALAFGAIALRVPAS